MRETAAVIRNCQRQFLAIAGEVDVDLVCVRVFNGVHHRLLSDVIKLSRRRRITDVDGFVTIEAAGNSESLTGIGG